MNKVTEFVEKNRAEIYNTLEELCKIPAPSGMEAKRAEYCKKWLETIGAEGVYIDEALNVIFPLNCENSNEITVYAAHTDTVFPDLEPMPYIDDGKNIHSPGVADDTASVVALLMMAKYFVENNYKPENGVMFVCNSCEEGLGNLKGTRKLFADYGSRVKQFITFDSILEVVYDRCVGSHRYKVEVFTEGGHSYGAFGKKNAIHAISQIVNAIYEIKVPEKVGAKTTYNVGDISGGTSVNTIAQNAQILCEYRSDDIECLEYMQKKFEEIFEKAQTDEVSIKVTKVGDRPCASIEPEKIESLKALIVPVIEEVVGKKVIFTSASTDSNIPLSMGIPALCVGVNTHTGTHTREECMDKESIVTGIKSAIKISEKLMEA